VEGEVARVTFEKRRRAFRVLKLTVRGGRAAPRWWGPLPATHVGAHVRVEAMMGRTVVTARSPAEGATEASVPSTTKGIERYSRRGRAGRGKSSRPASSDLRRRRLSASRQGRAARGPSPGSVKRRAVRWRRRGTREGRARRAGFLQAHGALGDLAARIAKAYGANAIRHRQRDPYRLALDVTGIGFKTADAWPRGSARARLAGAVQAGLLAAAPRRDGDGARVPRRFGLDERAWAPDVGRRGHPSRASLARPATRLSQRGT